MGSKHILVTGGAGFIGNHLCEALLELGHSVVAFDNLSLGTERNISRFENNDKFIFIKGDILRPEEFDSVFEKHTFDAIFHLAANSDIGNSWKDPLTDYRNTFQTTMAVVEAARVHGIKQIVFASTGAIYGDTNVAVAENTGPLVPISHYGAAKLSSESFLSAYSHNYGIKVWIARFPNVVGEYATHGAIYDFVRKLKDNPNELEVLGDGQQCKPYIYVKEIVDAILFIWTNATEEFNVYNVGVDSQTRVSQLAEMVIETMRLPATIRYTGGSRGWVGDVSQFKYDFSKLKKLGWQPNLHSDEAAKLAVQKIVEEQTGS